MDKRKLSSLFMGLILLMGCAGSETKENDRIDIASAFADQKELKTSDYFTKARYVPLETTDESVIGTGADITILEDKIMVTTSQKQCLLFDKETGRFLATVGHYGEDPEGYRTSSGWYNYLTQTIFLNSWHKSWCTYDVNGDFKQKYNLPEALSTEGSFVPLDNRTIAVHTMDFFADGIESVRIFSEDSLLHTIVLHEQDRNFNVNNIASIYVLKGDYNQEVYGTGTGVLVVDFIDSPGNAYIGIMGLQRMWRLDDKVYLKTEYNDTIFQLKNKALEPAYRLDLGEYHWPYEERFNMAHDHSLLVTKILDSRNLMLFRLVHRLFTDEKRIAYNAIYDKTTGELKINPVEKGIVDDLSGFLPFRPITVSPVGEYAGMIQAFDVAEWFEGKGKSDIPPEIEHLSQVNEEDNPIVVLFE